MPILALPAIFALFRTLALFALLAYLLWCSYYASMLASKSFEFFPPCLLLLQPACSMKFHENSSLLAYYNLHA